MLQKYIDQFFFFFFDKKTENFIKTYNKNETSCVRACFIKQEFSSIHARKSTIHIACFASKRVGLLPCL